MDILKIGIFIIYFLGIHGLIYILIKDRKLDTLKQLLYIAIAISVFYLSALFSTTTQKTKPMWIFADGLAILPIPIILFVLVMKKRKIVSQKQFKLDLKQAIKKNRYQISLAMIVAASRIGLLDTIQKWDSNDYYYSIMKACREFDFSPQSFFSAFKLINHPSHGYAFWVSIGEFLLPENPIGVNIVCLILTIFASIKLYELFQCCQKSMSQKQAFFGTLLCLFTPLVWCSVSYIMPDYLMAIFIVLMICADVQKKWILLFFWALMACFSKEIGIVLVASYFFSKVLLLFFRIHGNIKDRIFEVIKNNSIKIGLADGIVVIFYLILNRGVSSWSHSVYYSDPISWSGTGELLYNTFGIQADNIFTRLKEFFLINFTWLFTVSLIVGVAIFIVKNKWKVLYIQLEYVIGIIGILLAYALFMCLYITSGAIRYNVVFSMLFIMVSYMVLIEIVNEKISFVFSAITLCLMFIQSFYSIDVITNTLFNTIDVGNTKMLCISQKSHQNPGGDYYVTNLQYRTISSNFEKMFQEIQLTQEDTILIAGQNYVECTKNASLAELNGRHNDLQWSNEEQQYRNIYYNDSRINTLTTNSLWGLNTIPVKDCENLTEVVLKNLRQVKGRVFVYFSPLFQSEKKDVLLQQLEMVFEFGEMKRVETGGNVLEFCELYKKGEKEIKKQLSKIENFEKVIENDTKEKEWISNREKQKYAVEFSGDRKKIKLGDTIAVSIACYENGKYLNLGYSPKGMVLTNITIGNGNVLMGIEEKLIGVNVGSTIEVTCAFPKNYRNNPEVGGKTLTMSIHINSIERELPGK